MPTNPAIDNPAGRLHHYLTLFQVAAERNTTSCLTIWAKVLETPIDSISLITSIGRIGSLFEETLARLREADLDKHANGLRKIEPQAMRAFSLADGFIFTNHSSAQAIDEAALAMLDLVATVLSVSNPDGSIPTPEEEVDLREKLADLRNDIREDPDLPAEIKRLILQRLNDIEVALDEVSLGGPDGVKSALERLGATIAYSTKKDRDHKIRASAMILVHLGLTLFNMGSDIEGNIESWGNMIGSVASEVQQIESAPPDTGE